jgi:hypothetical protein
VLQDHLAHLGTWMPFAQARAMLERFTHVLVSTSSAQRHTETVGMAYEAVQLAAVERIEQDWPEVPNGPEKVVLSVDGAFVPLLHGDWAEVKTLVVGEVGAPIGRDGESLAQTHSLSYFSRLAEAETFQRLTLGELYRRHLETARQVAVVSDGAEWIQGFADFHCPDALRVLDFPHAAERISQIGDVVLGEGREATAEWRTNQLHDLKHAGAAALLPELRAFAADQLSVPLVTENLTYLEKRVEQMQYPTFLSQGWPIGSGIAESANKLVVEARLKGAGMHWARPSVNPMLALRNAVCNDRWDEAWQQSTKQIRQVGLVRRPVQPKYVASPAPAVQAPAPVTPPAREPAPEPATRRKPTANHPWRRYPVRVAAVDQHAP